MTRVPTSRVRCPEVSRALEGIKYIAAVTRAEEESNKVINWLTKTAVTLAEEEAKIFSIVYVLLTYNIEYLVFAIEQMQIMSFQHL
jgi:hypothetical protein